MKGGRSTKHVKMDIPVLSESCSTLIHCQVEHTIFMTTKEARTYLDQARKFVLRLKFLFVGSIILVASLNSAMSSFKNKSAAVMLITFFFAVTTPFGIALGIGISAPYNENSPTALIVEGVFNAASSGILIYMALVDLLAADFINPSWLKQNGTLQL